MMDIGTVVVLQAENPSGTHGLVVEVAGEKLRVAGLATESGPGAQLEVEVEADAGWIVPAQLWLTGDVRWAEPLECGPVGRAGATAMDRVLRELVLDGVRAYHGFAHKPRPFEPGVSSVPVSGRVYDFEEVASLAEATMDFWLTTGRFNDAFEKAFGEFAGLKHVLTCNSGSSANLLAVAALTSPSLGERRLKPGDEVITVAAGFPTTVNPMLQYGLIPVFVDVDLSTCCVRPELLAQAVGPRTRAIMMAHTLGNVFNLDAVMELAHKHDLWVIEDCCDALGSTWGGKPVGGFGHLATFSFYPAHHITMGEGGAVGTNDPKLRKLVESFRDWGRDCWCPPGKNDTCCRRFDWRFEQLPPGYDHKYVYSHVGYNLKITDMQAAVGLAQLSRLPGFIEQRKANFAHLRARLEAGRDRYILPEATPGSDPSWFGFPLTMASPEPGRREACLRHLNQRKIDTRLMFGGNLLRQPYFKGQAHRVAGELVNTDIVMNRTFWVGIYPGLGPAQIDYIADSLLDFA